MLQSMGPQRVMTGQLNNNTFMPCIGCNRFVFFFFLQTPGGRVQHLKKRKEKWEFGGG